MDFIEKYAQYLSQASKNIKHLFIKVPSLISADLDMYLDNLQLEFEQSLNAGFTFNELETLYISSGQSEDFVLEEIALCIEKFLNFINFSKDYEFTIEVTAEAVSDRSLLRLKNIGVNRLVFNFHEINLFYDYDLHYLCNIAKEIGFNNLSIDYLYNNGVQTLKSIEKDLQEIINAGIKHIYIEDVYAERDVEEVIIKNEREQYHFIRDFLLNNNFKQSELLAFNIEDKFKSKHNLDYWNGKDYLGLGIGAVSKIGNLRFKNKLIENDYILYFDKEDLYSLEEEMTSYDLIFDYFVLTINDLKGFNEIDFQKYTGINMSDFYLDKLEDLSEIGLLQRIGDNWVLTSKGLDKINFILASFIC